MVPWLGIRRRWGRIILILCVPCQPKSGPKRIRKEKKNILSVQVRTDAQRKKVGEKKLEKKYPGVQFVLATPIFFWKNMGCGNTFFFFFFFGGGGFKKDY